MLIDNHRHIHIYENAFSQFFNRRDVTHFLADYKGAEPSQPGPSQKCKNLVSVYKTLKNLQTIQKNS